MGFPQAPTPPHLYPESLQIKLYQAFIFSIPILFSIILFLLFYLFYLKRRASAVSSSTQESPLPVTSFHEAPFASSSVVDFKGILKDKLPIILVDEDTRKRDSLCCVCLGEFEMEEELHQIPACRHVFHVDCIRFWLQSNPTCPLCRCFIGLTTTTTTTTTTTSTSHSHAHSLQPPVGVPDPVIQDTRVSNPDPHMVSQEQLQEDMGDDFREHHIMVRVEGSSSTTSDSESTCMGLNEVATYPRQDEFGDVAMYEVNYTV